MGRAVGFTPRRQQKAARNGLSPLLVKFNVVSGGAMAFAARRRDLLLPIPPEWLHDGWIALLLSLAGKCRWINQPLSAYRQRPGQLIGAPRRTWLQQLDVARRMDAAYFDRMVASVNFTECLHRLDSAAANVSPQSKQMLRDKKSGIIPGSAATCD